MTSARVDMPVLNLTDAQKDRRLSTLISLACWNKELRDLEIDYYQERGCLVGVNRQRQMPRPLPAPVPAREAECQPSEMPEEDLPSPPTARELRIARRREEAYGIKYEP